LSYFSQTPRNPEAPDYIKSFEEEVLNQVKNLIEVQYNYAFNSNMYYRPNIIIMLNKTFEV